MRRGTLAVLVASAWAGVGVPSALHAQGHQGAPSGEAFRCRASERAMLAYLEEFDRFYRGVGGAAAIARRGQIIFSGAWGVADLEHRVPVTPETRFFIASVAKAFTGVALLRLVQDGAIDLDAPVEHQLPAFQVPGGSAVTARHLAAHLSGVRHWKPEEREAAFLAKHYDDPAAAVALVARDSLIAPPGSRYLYSSLNYNILAALVQQASGRPFQRYVTEQVLEPLGLRQTSFDDVRLPVPGRARGYSYWYPWFSRNSSDTLRRVPDFDYSLNAGGGNMLSSAADLVRFGSALLTPGFLGAEKLQMLHGPIANGSPWTFGFVVARDDSLSNPVLRITGSDPGFQASLTIYPERQLVVALVQNSWGIRAQPPPQFADPIHTLSSMCLGTEPR